MHRLQGARLSSLGLLVGDGFTLSLGGLPFAPLLLLELRISVLFVFVKVLNEGFDVRDFVSR